MAKNITQAMLEDIYNMEQQKAVLESSIKAAYAALEVDLAEGKKVAPGKYVVSVKETVSVRPKWKEEYELLCNEVGKKFPLEESKIKARTEASISKKLVVTLTV